MEKLLKLMEERSNIKIYEILLFIFFIFFFTKVSAELKLTPILEDLNKPWSITSKSNSEHLITEKSGNIIFFNKNKSN